MGLSEGGCDVPTTQNTPPFKIDFEHPKTEQPEMELNGKAAESTEKDKEGRIEPSEVTEEHENGPGDPEAPLADPLCRPVLDAHEQPGAACIEGQAEQPAGMDPGGDIDETLGKFCADYEDENKAQSSRSRSSSTGVSVGGGVRESRACEAAFIDIKPIEAASDENQLSPGVQAPRECLSPRRQIDKVGAAGWLLEHSQGDQPKLSLIDGRDMAKRRRAT